MSRATALSAIVAFGLLTISGSATHAAQPPVRAVRAACALNASFRARAPGIDTSSHPATPGDLAYVEARSSRTGSIVRIYHEAGKADATRPRAACLGALIDMVSQIAPDSRKDVHWSAVAATADTDYVPPRANSEARWLDVLHDGRWDETSLKFLILTMPHEETHLSQSRPGAPRLPRWFQEGHAEWTGLHVTEQIRPDLALARRADLAAAHRAAGLVHLAQWGGMKVRPEALERQMSAEDRARHAADPGYVPKGPFHFGPGDFVQDTENGNAYYDAALAVFDGLEERHGRAAVQTWIAAVMQSPDASGIVELAKEKLGEDIEPLLR